MGVLLNGVSGLSGVKAKIQDADGNVWDGSSMVAPSTKTDAQLLAAMLACTEQVSADGTGTGAYAPSPDWPAGLTEAGVYHVLFYLNPAGPDDEIIGEQQNPTNHLDAAKTAAQAGDAMTLAASEDVYHADVGVSIDGANSQDEYTIMWFKNGVRQTSGITVPTIQVVKRADGTDLVAQQTPTQIGSTGSYKYDEGTNRITAGQAVLVLVGATIDGSARAFSRVISRDSST